MLQLYTCFEQSIFKDLFWAETFLTWTRTSGAS